MKKILLGAIPFASVLAVLPIAAACGGTGRFDQNERDKLRIATGFSKTGPQGQALQGIVDVYNKWVKDNNKKAEGYMEVDVITLPNGYNTDVLSAKLQAKDTREFWNIIVNYPTAASLIAKYEMNLTVPDEEYENFGLSKAFKDVNSLIAGNFKNEKWAVPLSRSSEMNAIAKPLLGKLLKDLTDLGVQKGTKHAAIDSYIESYVKVAAGKKSFIDKLWDAGKVANVATVKDQILQLVPTISDESFENYEDLINMSIAMKKIYPNVVDNYVLGFDFLPTAINVMAASLSKGDYKDNYITPDSKIAVTGGWDFASFLKPGTKQYQLFKKISDLLIKGIDEGAIWVGGGGKYGSSSLSNFKLAMSIGSTAGYSHTFIRSAKDLKKYTIKDTTSSLENNSLELKTTNSNDKTPDSTAFWFNSLNNKNTNSVKLSTETQIGRFDKQLKDAAADEKAKALKGKEGWIVSGPAWSFKDGKVVFTYVDTTKTQKTVEFSGLELGDIFKDDNSDDKNYFYLEKDAILVQQLTENNVVVKNDATWISSPEKYGKTDEKHGVFSQGPSLVGIHATEKQDKATRLFMKWIFTQKHDEISLKTGRRGSEVTNTYTKVTALDAFNFESSYVSPTEEYFTKAADSAEIQRLNPASKLGFENFKKANTDENYIIVEDVAAAESDALRRAITSAAGGLVTAAQSGTEITFQSLLNGITKAFKVKG
ncbi:P68 family surface lipoprotein [Mycoplasma phocoeninasale]|uniref:P68 family surface lipoprotein n=1 Tax=Mycoplasma phocoeninasale TaxID=2726117 RepID=UPI00196767A0|nr:P80 family lipoprotein [Mycoplasma phocoeninasale]